MIGAPHRPRNHPYRQCSERRWRITRWLCRLLSSGLVVILVAVAANAAPAGESISAGWSWVGPPMRHVGIVGDSLTYQAEHGSDPDPYYQRHHLTDLFSGDGYARVAAKSGANTSSLRSWGQWETAPDVIVMALGTNDRRYEPPSFPMSLNTSKWNVVNYLNQWPSAKVVLVGIVEAPNRWRHNIYGPVWNDWLQWLAAQRGYVFVDWWGISQGHPEWFTSDLLHHTAAGQEAYRAAILDGVRRAA